jgi:hypothetical protein
MLGVLAATAVFWLFVVGRRLAGASNHVGWDVGSLRILFAFGVLLGGAAARASRRRLALGCLLASLASLGAAQAVDTWNLLVPYETWVRRGMPEAGERTPGQSSSGN